MEQEMSSILKEIDQLQQGLKESMSGSAILDAAIAEESQPEQDEASQEPVSTPSVSAETSPGTLTMSLQGSMNLRLNYDVGGQSVTISFSDQTLKVQLANGAEFRIPVGATSGRHLKAV